MAEPSSATRANPLGRRLIRRVLETMGIGWVTWTIWRIINYSWRGLFVRTATEFQPRLFGSGHYPARARKLARVLQEMQEKSRYVDLSVSCLLVREVFMRTDMRALEISVRLLRNFMQCSSDRWTISLRFLMTEEKKTTWDRDPKMKRFLCSYGARKIRRVWSKSNLLNKSERGRGTKNRAIDW